MPDPHPLLGPLATAVGTWTGSGTGRLPGEPSFTWQERLVLTTPGTPALAFQQRTTRPDGTPFHAEDGWVRVPPELQEEGARAATVELAVTSPTGVLEACSGTLTSTPSGFVLDATSTAVVGTAGARTVHGTRRRWMLDGQELVVDFWMATPRHPTTFHHLTSRLRRTTQDQE